MGNTEKVLWCVLVLVAAAFAFPQSKRMESDAVQRLDDLFPVSIVHINDFHARYLNACAKFRTILCVI